MKVVVAAWRAAAELARCMVVAARRVVVCVLLGITARGWGGEGRDKTSREPY